MSGLGASPAAGQWRDLEVEVRAENGDFKARILTSSLSRPASDFVPVFEPTEAVERLAAVEQAVRRSHHGKAISPADAERDQGLARTVGELLFRSLFPPAFEAALRTTLAQGEKHREGVTIRVSFDPTSETLLPYSALPWEMLFDPQTERFVGQSPHTSLLRYVDVPVPIERLRADLPLNVLLVSAEPLDCSPTYGDEAVAEIKERLGNVPGVQVDLLEPPTLVELTKQLGRRDYHVLHFMGHGYFERCDSPGAGLVFENAERRYDCVSAEKLGQLLRRSPDGGSLRLVVLNTCWGAANPRKLEQTSVALALIEHGVPAVIGMQFPVSINAAFLFGESFYAKLAATGDVDAAMADARVHLAEKMHDSIEWITPVLLSRSQRDRLFEPERQPEPGEPLKVGIQSFVGWGARVEEWSDRFLTLRSFFNDRFLRPGVRWKEDVYPRLERFVRERVVTEPGERQVDLEMPVHATLAFATGYLVEAKAGIPVTLVQRGEGKPSQWSIDDEPRGEHWQWLVEKVPVAGGGPDFALCVSATNLVRPDVEAYLRSKLPEVGTLVDFRPPGATGGPNGLSVHDGRHAQALATAIKNEMYGLAAAVENRVFHLFYSGPNTLLFFLGRVAKGGRQIQLYEFDFEGKGTKSYTPSLRFPVET